MKTQPESTGLWLSSDSSADPALSLKDEWLANKVAIDEAAMDKDAIDEAARDKDAIDEVAMDNLP